MTVSNACRLGPAIIFSFLQSGMCSCLHLPHFSPSKQIRPLSRSQSDLPSVQWWECQEFYSVRKRASIDNVRTRTGGGGVGLKAYNNTNRLRDCYIDRGGQKYRNYCDVINGRPLTRTDSGSVFAVTSLTGFRGSVEEGRKYSLSLSVLQVSPLRLQLQHLPSPNF